MPLLHTHLIYQAEVNNDLLMKTNGLEGILEDFLQELIDEIDMKCLILPQVKNSHLDAWTGLVGIVTSHIAFHYWVKEKYVQLDIYSCKNFDHLKAIEFINKFWQASSVKAIHIIRNMDEEYQIKRL